MYDDDPEAYINRATATQLAIAQNVAANGRAFCLALVAICLVAHLKTPSHYLIILAVVAASPIGVSVFADQCPMPRLRSTMVLVAYLAAIIVAVLLLVGGF